MKMENYDRYKVIESDNKVKKLLLFRNDKLIKTFYLNNLIEVTLKRFGFTKI